MARTYIWVRCPHCGKTISISSLWGAFPESKLGKTEMKVCSNCGGQYSNGKKEWLEMNWLEKILEIARFVFLNLFGGFVFGLVIGIGLCVFFDFDFSYLIIVGSIVWFVVSCLMFISTGVEINESNKRYAAFQKSNEGSFKYFSRSDE